MIDTEAELRARIVTLESEVATLRAERRRIALPALPSGFELPTDQEMRALANCVWRARPQLAPPLGKKVATLDRFARAFIAVSCLSRRADGKLDVKHDKVVFLDRCTSVLRSAGLAPDIDLAAFMSAVFASGDVPHSFDPARYPCDLSFALVAVGDYGGRPATPGAWRRVLVSAALLPATPLPKPVRNDAAPVGLVRQAGASW